MMSRILSQSADRGISEATWITHSTSQSMNTVILGYNFVLIQVNYFILENSSLQYKSSYSKRVNSQWKGVTWEQMITTSWYAFRWSGKFSASGVSRLQSTQVRMLACVQKQGACSHMNLMFWDKAILGAKTPQLVFALVPCMPEFWFVLCPHA